MTNSAETYHVQQHRFPVLQDSDYSICRQYGMLTDDGEIAQGFFIIGMLSWHTELYHRCLRSQLRTSSPLAFAKPCTTPRVGGAEVG